MHKLMAIAETLILERVLSGGFLIPQKSRAGLALLLLSGILGLVATGYLIVAFHIWVQTQFSPELAALTTAGAVFALAIAAALTGMNILHQRRMHALSLKQDMKATLQSAIASFDGELGDHVRDNPLAAVLLAGLAGYVIADRVNG